MADLIVQTARGSEIDVYQDSTERRPYPDTKSTQRHFGTITGHDGHDYVGGQQSTAHAGHDLSKLEQGLEDGPKGITRQREIQVRVHDSGSDEFSCSETKPVPILEEDEEEVGNVDRLESRQSRVSNGSQIPLKELSPHSQYTY